MSFAQTGFDRRRINGPEESKHPVFDDEHTQEAEELLPRKGRSPTELRPIFLQPGLVSQANGSAYIETQNTKIACAVYGPRQSSQSTAYSERAKLNVEVKFAPFSCTKRRVPIRDAEDRSISTSIHQALLASLRLDLLPKTTIDVFINIIEADGLEACVAAGSIAASTALADAGIEMFGLVVACAAAVVGEETFLDPTDRESRASTGSVVLACMPALGTVTSLWQSGRMKPVDVIECAKICEKKCTEIHSIVAQALLDSPNLNQS
ncbi:3' exoribonuclease family, domain 1-domain-containing protein [Pterulicium gracile]|uniref:3' exoribonuclease family, domain 1-domain-containing protein n=1 Tax=Pterulicium gracile TaxID=1884261 RepID=A0A5C3QA34_9AGAR|nr:3' exoribonuclease family, domain 1-domain-containing protein [Pterula gracilis]